LAVTRAVVERYGGIYFDPGRNLGFAAGVNYALRRRRGGGDVLLLNPDATISPDHIARLRERLAEDPMLAAVAPAQFDPRDGSAARVCWPRPTPAGAWMDAVGLGSHRDPCGFVIGSVLLLRAAALDDVGLFDEQFFLYAEETDWEIRAQKRGWRIGLVAEAVAGHVGAGTGGDPIRRETHFHASHERLIRKHFGRTGWQIYRTGTLLGALIRMTVGGDTRRAGAARRFRLYRRGPCRAEALLPRPDPVVGPPASPLPAGS
jgi:GT2 family glycosyltransferase